MLSRVQLFVTPRTVALQAPLSMGFPRQEYWSALPFLSPGDLPDPGIKLARHSCTSEPLGWGEAHGKQKVLETLLEFKTLPQGEITLNQKVTRLRLLLPGSMESFQWL